MKFIFLEEIRYKENKNLNLPIVQYKEIIVQYKELVLYLIFGILTTAVNILTYLFFTRIFNINYLISNILAWLISVLFAYITNRVWVFKSNKSNILLEFSLFIGGRIFSGVLDSVLLYSFVSLAMWNDFISKIIIGIIVVIINYIFNKIIVFKKK